MRRTTSLTATTLLGLALLAPAAADGAGETCRGEAATIVGTPAGQIEGTEGRDVVVTNGSRDVDARGGDDLVCITDADLAGAEERIFVDAGAGDDLVDGTAAPSWRVDATLGTGSDRFEGGAGTDVVLAGPESSADPSEADREPDVLLGGGGNDSLYGAQDGLAASDVLDGGYGDDVVSAFRVPSAGATLAGGPGSDTLQTGTTEHPLHWDMSGDVLRVGEAWTVPVSGFEDAYLAAPLVTVAGTSEDNDIVFVGCVVLWRGFGGDDSFRVASDQLWESYRSCNGDTVMVGGPGDDRFRTYGRGKDQLRGGQGNDVFESKGGPDTVLGGGGRDRATTGPGADRFLGGPGKDRVDGERGRDRCVAEREVRCER